MSWQSPITRAQGHRPRRGRSPVAGIPARPHRSEVQPDECPAGALSVYHPGYPRNLRRVAVSSIGLTGFDIEQLTELLSKAQAELASREKQNRKNSRAELERRVAAEGYGLAEIFPEFGTASSGPARRKRPPRYRDPQNPDRTWGGPDAPRSGCRPSSTSVESTSPPSSPSRCTGFTPRTDPDGGETEAFQTARVNRRTARSPPPVRQVSPALNVGLATWRKPT